MSSRIHHLARVLQVLFKQLAPDGHLQLVKRVLHHVVGVQVVYRVQQMVQTWGIRRKPGHVTCVGKGKRLWGGEESARRWRKKQKRRGKGRRRVRTLLRCPGKKGHRSFFDVPIVLGDAVTKNLVPEVVVRGERPWEACVCE